jgi:thiamine-monophosphate kinase
MIDVSDGLLADLGHLADASGVGFALDGVPVAPGASLDEALGGGEDYELILAASDPASVEEAFERRGLRSPTIMGVCTPDPAERTLEGRAVARLGWEHPWG